MKVVERDFTLDGRMKPGSAADRRNTKGFLPFYSVDTREEADALVQLALEAGELVLTQDGELYETTLMYEQNINNLRTAGANLAALHAQLADPEALANVLARAGRLGQDGTTYQAGTRGGDAAGDPTTV